MTSPLTLILFLVAAALYAFVGHGGGSAYAAIMGGLGWPRDEMRVTGLVLNLLVSGIAFACFAKQDRVRKDLLLLTAAGGVPCAFLGAKLGAPAPLFWGIIGAALAFASLQMISPEVLRRTRAPEKVGAPLRSKTGLVLMGAALGFIAGMCGIGGGVFLSPLLLVIGACDTRETAGVSAGYIFVNSLAGLGGATIPHAWEMPWGIAAVVVVGGTVGAYLGARIASPVSLRRGLGLVLVVAAYKCFTKAL
jgi:uncharacterized membrane protein YfcA